MYHYEFNIGDYRKDTGHLSLLEHGIYRMLIDTYYASEGPIPADDAKLMRTHCIRTADEQQAYRNVIEDFFELQDEHYHHGGCDKVLNKIYAKSASARASALARWEKKNANASKKDANAMQEQCEDDASDMLPITHNPIPITQVKPSKSPKGVSDRKFSDEDLRCAEFVFAGIQRIAPRTKPPNIGKWADQVRLMRESDQLTHREICEVFVWANQDSFWSTNILSISKLREKFAALSAKRESENAKHSGHSQSGLQPAAGREKLSTVGRNNQRAEQYLERIRREADEAPGDHGPIVATVG